VPDEAEEGVRDLLRCRDDIRRDVLRWRHRVLKLLTRHGRVYVLGRNWSQRLHISLIRRRSRLLVARADSLRKFSGSTRIGLDFVIDDQEIRNPRTERLTAGPSISVRAQASTC